MQLTEAILQALQTAWSHKLRSFFTLLGIIVSVAFLVAVVAVLQGLNADVRERRPVVELGYDIADKLFEGNVALAVGQRIRILGQQYLVKGVVAKKGTVLGQSWDGFVMLPLTSFEALYGRRKTTVISVKMPEATLVQHGMQRA